jgi:hypothetical protein
MSIQKDRAAFRQPIDVRSSGLWMAAKTSNPIILIINCDHQNIGLHAINRIVRRDQGKKDGRECPDQIYPGNVGAYWKGLQEDGSSKLRLDRELVILAIPGKK